MPHFVRGKIKFEHNETGTVLGAEDTVETFSCHPPPAGRRTGANPQLNYPPLQPANFLQAAEKTRIEKFAANSGENLTFGTVLSEIKTNFRINPLTINLADVPQAWRQPVPCHDITIVVVVKSVLLKVDAIAKEDLTLDGVTWPTGDTIASFRIIVPDQYRFMKYKTRNIECCPLNEGETMPRYDPENGDWSRSNFNPFGTMELKPYYPYGWGMDGRWNWQPRLEYRIPYRFLGEDEENEEELKPVPQWIWPKFEYKF